MSYGIPLCVVTRNKLIDALVSWQNEQGLNDPALARLLGIRQPTVSRLKSGDRGVGRDVLAAIAGTIPELQPLIIEYLLEGNGRT